MTDITLFKRFRLMNNSKLPSIEWNKKNHHMWRSGMIDGNVGIPCGSINNITVIDLDFYKMDGTNKFINRFENYIEKE